MKKALVLLCLGYGAYRGYGYYQSTFNATAKLAITEDVTLGELKKDLGEPNVAVDGSGTNYMYTWADGGLRAYTKGNSDGLAPHQIQITQEFKGQLRGLRVGQPCSEMHFPVEDERQHDKGMNHAGLRPGDPEQRWGVMWTEDSDHKVTTIVLAKEVKYGYCPRGALYKTVGE